jgi:hypothetical protein
MYGYPAGSPYQSFQAPLTKENQLRMLEGQIEALKSMGSSTPQYSLLEEINNFSSNLTEDEKKLIEKSPEYSEAKGSFEAGFMSFLGSKFSSEYVATPQGKVAGERLLEVIKDVKSKAQQEIAAKQEKLQKVADLLDKHPELLDKIK